MTATSFLDGRVTLHGGDCLDVLKTLPDASVDSVVTDPPYHLTSIVKRFGGANAAPARAKQTGAFTRASRGFMGKTWDGGDIAFRPELWAEVLRVLKPGGHLAAFSGTRTQHRMVCAIEDAGFEIRDQVAWVYSSGMPKAHDVAKAIDARALRGTARTTDIRRMSMGDEYEPSGRGRVEYDNGSGSQMNGATGDYVPVTDEAREWQGWKSSLKPAWEPICLARRPLDGTIAGNVLAYGVGALNIGGCRVASEGGTERVGEASQGRRYSEVGGTNFAMKPGPRGGDPHGRFPANLIHDGSPEVLAAFPDAPGQQRYVGPEHGDRPSKGIYGDFGARPQNPPRGDSGSAARFFYSSKADSDDRIGSKHPTVKPVDLMQWLVRLITPKGGMVLDPFAGTGTTGEAAWREGCSAVLIEREAEYQADIARRMAMVLSGPDERKRRMAALKPEGDVLPLFGGEAA